MNSNKLACFSLAFIFIYQGLVPKLIFLDKTELYINQKHLELLPAQNLIDAVLMAQLAGIGEIMLGLLLIIFHQKNWPIWICLGFLSVLLLDIIVLAPELLTGAFNPLSTNIAAMLLAYIAIQPKVNSWKIN